MKSIFCTRTLLKHITCLLLLGNVLQAQNVPGGNFYPTGTVPPVQSSNFVGGVKVNYVRSIALTVPVVTEGSIQPTDYDQSRVKTEYMDGLGRLIQTVDHFASPGASDIVNVTKYDNFGRDAFHFLPFAKSEPSANENGKFKLTPYTDQVDFYKNTLGYTDKYFYTQTKYEPSPLNRVVKSLAQGNSWVGTDRGTSVIENPLPAGANIRLFTIAYPPASLPVSAGVYATGNLSVKTTTDEDGYFTEEYTDKDNRLVLKTTGKTGNAVKLQTYYVYDDFGLLRYVIPPKATVWLSANSWTLTAAISKELCFNYLYDARLRMNIKNIPGAGTQYLVYNSKDEVILTQTPTQASKGEWMFNKYDVLGRLIQTGIYNSTSSATALQEIANVPYNGTDAFLIYLFKEVYGNAAYVNTFTNAKVLTTNYYDDYSFTTRTYNTSFMNALPAGWNTTLSQETTNLLTGTKTVVLDGAVTPTTLLTVNFYNDRGLLLQSQLQNHKGGWNIVTNSYDFKNQKLGTYTEINNPQATDNATIKTVETYSYDHAGRIRATTHTLNDVITQVSPVNHNYDELGRLANKNFSNGMTPSIEYDYNVRGWISGINKNYCLYASTDQSFGMEINYNYGYTNNCYNGNIAGIKWRNKGKANELRTYGYKYDDYNRLQSGDFRYRTGTIEDPNPWITTALDYTASNMLYDENGNLKSMKQLGLNPAGQKIILDDLTYSYTANSNKLLSVSESASSQSKSPTTYDNLGDFRDVAGTTDYSYDTYGNMLTDANKSLTFTYDELVNKTKRVTKGTQNVDYLYDANTNKLQKKVSPGTVTTTDYVGTAVYINNSLSFISHSEGRIRYNGAATNKYVYDYYIKDHLGSTRSVVTYTEGAITGFTPSAPKEPEPINYIATSEPDNAAKENQLFDNIETTRSPKLSNKTVTDNYVAKINSTDTKTTLGPDITLRVMAGDVVKISAEALYIKEKSNVTEVAKNVVNNFITAFTTLPTLAAEGVSTIANSNTKDLATAVLNMQNKNTWEGAPKAFLNYILYDEYMNLIAEGSGALQVKEKNGWQTLETEKMEIPQNGFLRVFSNNMEATPVSINNTTLSVIPGKLVEEYNYYPYGLVFGASSANSSIKKTDYLYNGKELQRNEFGAGNGLELEDYGARLYDVQIGRWAAVDPLAGNNLKETPYCYVGNNPIRRIDPDGNDWMDILAGAAIGAVTNIVPGSTGLRNSYTPNDAGHYNATLRAVDNTAAVVGAGAMILGADEMAAGGATVLVGAGFTATGAGAPLGIPTMIGGGTVAVKGAITAGAGALLMSNSAANKNAGYNYGGAQNKGSAQTQKQSKVDKTKTTEKVGNFTKTTEVRPGKGPGQSRAEYIRYKNADGKTIKNVKDSYDRAGKLQHRKHKPLPK